MGPKSALESGFENPDRRSLGPRVRIGIWIPMWTRPPPLGGGESALESGLENLTWRPLGPRVRIGIWIRKPQPCIANAISLCKMSRASTLKAIGNAIGVVFSNVDSPPRGGPSPHQHLDSGRGPAPPPSPPPSPHRMGSVCRETQSN